MNYLIALIIFMTFHGSFSVPIKWSSPIIHGNYEGTYMRYFGVYVLANSDTLVIALNSLSEKTNIISYNRVLNNGTLTAPKFIDMNRSSFVFYGMDSKIADDRKHVMLVYTSENPKNMYRQNIHFRESFDEGDTWSPYLDVKRPNEEENLKRAPSIAIEESTGKLALFYVQSTEQRLYIRDSGAKNFKEIYNGIIENNTFSSRIKFTYDRENSIRYIHLFYTSALGNSFCFYYSRSADQGKTWNKTILAKSNVINNHEPTMFENI